VETRVLSASQEVIIGGGRPTVLIGERINPTGKKRLAEALRAGDLSVAKEEALAQVAAGADILDVNVGATGVDEIDMLPRAVEAVASVVNVPLCIDSRKIKALAAALAIFHLTCASGKFAVQPVLELRRFRQIIQAAPVTAAGRRCGSVIKNLFHQR